MVAGPCDPSTAKPSAGVALVAHPSFKPAPLRGLNDGCAHHVRLGRLGVHLVDLGLGNPMCIFNLY
eukprot:2005610-Alexandrium_andersonii.AAC.1